MVLPPLFFLRFCALLRAGKTACGPEDGDRLPTAPVPEDRFVGVQQGLDYADLPLPDLPGQGHPPDLRSDQAGQTELEVVPLQGVQSLLAAAFLLADPLLDWRGRP